MKKNTNTPNIKEAKKITIKDLIAAKEKIEGRAKETKELYIESLNAKITIMKPDRSLCLESLDIDDPNEADINMVYNCIIEPNLKDEELRKAYGVVRPCDIVEKIFEPGEIASISKECINLAGYVDSVKVVEDLKN